MGNGTLALGSNIEEGFAVVVPSGLSGQAGEMLGWDDNVMLSFR